MDWSRASDAVRVCDPGAGDQCPKERKPIFFTEAIQPHQGGYSFQRFLRPKREAKRRAGGRWVKVSEDLSPANLCRPDTLRGQCVGCLVPKEGIGVPDRALRGPWETPTRPKRGYV